MARHTFRNSDGNLYVRYWYWNDGALQSNYNWLDNDWDVQNPALVLATLSYFSAPPSHGAEFCLVSCPFQPPSILPISSSGIESAPYFL